MGHCATERTPDLPDVPVMDWMTGNGVDRDKTWITSDTYHSVAANIVIYADAVVYLHVPVIMQVVSSRGMDGAD